MYNCKINLFTKLPRIFVGWYNLTYTYIIINNRIIYKIKKIIGLKKKIGSAYLRPEGVLKTFE